MVVMDLVTEVLGMVGREDVREVEGGTGGRVGEVGGEGGVDCELMKRFTSSLGRYLGCI